ncbi:ROK family protein [Aliiroseovarius sp.]|uniref:ROK family transcriptional regulator n=1 Tax=Aliiroseovarius sp. TaxID=1872442 RepID=UPI003BA8CBED
MAPSDKSTNGADQRESGRAQVLGVIRKVGQVARIDIAQEIGVSPATVTALTSELLAAGLIEEIAPEAVPGKPTGRGRPRVALRLRGAAHLIAGIKVAHSSLSVALVDFQGKTLHEHTAPMPDPKLNAQALVQIIRDTLIKALAGIDKTLSDLSGVGLGVAGVIDAPNGFVHWSPTLTQRNVQLRNMLQQAIDLPIFIDNDANLVAKAEQLFGEGRGVKDFIVVTVEHGVGMGIVIDGQIYRGTRGCGAEFGHTKVHLDGALCRCGQRGCLEAYVADYALLREAQLAVPPPGEGVETQLAQLSMAAKAGDSTAQSIFDRAGRMFALGLANIVNIFDPKLIILSGERMQFDYLYADQVIADMKSMVVQVDSPPPEVRIHKWGDLMWARGAAAYGIEGVTDLAVRAMSNA